MDFQAEEASAATNVSEFESATLMPSVQRDDADSLKIAVAIPTWNRIGYVKLASDAIRGTFPTQDIWIFDDQSDEYNEQDLRQWYGTDHVWTSDTKLHADGMARHIAEWFLTTEYDIVVTMDSDLVVAPDWVASLRKGLNTSTGVFSLYHSGAPTHVSRSCGEFLCAQDSIGNAGVVWRRDLLQRMLDDVHAVERFDWEWSQWCKRNDVALDALKDSAVLHIGIHGSWGVASQEEKSLRFPIESLHDNILARAERFLQGDDPDDPGWIADNTSSVVDPTEPIHILAGGKYRVVRNTFINLDRSQNRRRDFEQRWDPLNLTFNRLVAVDGQNLSVADVNHSVIQPDWDPNGHAGEPSMSPSEVAVSLSHLQSWQNISSSPPQSKFDFHCIFEDDAIPVADYRQKFVQALEELPEDTPPDMFYLWYWQGDHNFDTNVSKHVIHLRYVNGCVGYCLSYDGAVKLVQALPINDTVDNWIGFYLLPKGHVSAWGMRDYLVQPDPSRITTGSTIEHWSDYHYSDALHTNVSR